MSIVANTGMYPFSVSAYAPIGNPLNYVGAAAQLTGNLAITWEITQAANDGSVPNVTYSIDGGVTFTTVQIGSAGTPQAYINESGVINVSLTGATGIVVNVTATGGTASSTATPCKVNIGLSRNVTQGPAWDQPNPFDATSFNCTYTDFNGVASATLAQLRARIITRLGFANQANNPPPGMGTLVNDFLFDAQSYLYRRYTALHTKRWFRWTMFPGQRFYSLKDNDEDILSSMHLDPSKKIEYVAVQDSRNVWYPLIEGIPPQLYTMSDKPWRPARYELRQALEVYPMPDQVYYLWVRGHFGLLSFTNDSDVTTIDSNLVFLQALALAKAHYGQPDANNIVALANAYRGELIADSHQTARYIPGAVPVPPAVRPTMVQFSDTAG